MGGGGGGGVAVGSIRAGKFHTFLLCNKVLSIS